MVPCRAGLNKMEYANYMPEATRAPEDIRGRMKLNYIMNPGPVADPGVQVSDAHTPFARYMPFLGLSTAHHHPPHQLQEPDSIAYPGHPAFSHGSMGMNLLCSGFDTLPVANSGVSMIQNCFGEAIEDTCTSSASYEEVSEGSFRESVASESSPVATKEIIREEPTPSLSPDYAPPSASSELSSLPDYESEASPIIPQTAIPEAVSRQSSCPAPGPTSPTPSELCNSPRSPTISHLFVNPVLPQVWVRRQAEWAGFEEDPFSPANRSHFLSANNSRARKCQTNKITRYEDGEVLRYGAGESYRPFNRDRDRSPRRARSPLRDRDRERDRDHRARTPPVTSDSYVPNRSPRRRSRSPDRYRAPDRARDSGGESWRRRDSSRGRVRSPVRRVSPRRSPRRSPNRYSPGPRRDDRFDRVRSPRRDFDNRDR